MNDAPTPENDDQEPTPEHRGASYLVVQFLIFPLAIVAVGVGVFVLFGLITAEGKGPGDYLDLIRTGSSNRRWQAAYELSKVIQHGQNPELQDPSLVARMVTAFEDAEDDDPRVRRYLALALGRLGNPKAVPALLEYVEGARTGQGEAADSETHIYALWSLGSIGDPSALPELVAHTGLEDPGLRKTAVHALGVFDSEEARGALRDALGDPVEDVRWNAATALARHRDEAAVPVIEQMLNRDLLARSEAVTPEQTEEILLQAVAAAAFLEDPGLAEALEGLGENDPSLKVRDAARRSLDHRKALD